MWRLICVAFATISLLVVFSATAYAQALAPSALNLASHDQKTSDDMVQVITEKSAGKTPDKPITAITKKRTPVIARKPKRVKEETAQGIAKEPAQAIAKDSARTFLAEPVRPMNQPTVSTTAKPVSRFSFKSAEGKKESAPVITQYYPKQMVYPFGRVDRHIDGRLMQAASIAQERAHAHSRSRCWHYVKEALLASGVIDSRPKTELARDAAQELVSNYGFKRLSVTDPFSAPVGSVLVYGTSRSVGHVEFRTREGFVSDFRSPTPSRRPLLGVYAKL
ncbi:MAG: hypothetical protein DMF42_10865 [Verrucomicrobia bacterium]|nr:MAG: hypothetical protein DMF42_10865 [Verrucomicrobiota bacterium]